jgi:hypothetical protein
MAGPAAQARGLAGPSRRAARTPGTARHHTTHPPEPQTPAKPSTTAVGAFERGVAALAQYKTRTGSVTVPRGHVETLPDGSEVRLGVFLSNSKTRRAKLTADKRRDDRRPRGRSARAGGRTAAAGQLPPPRTSNARSHFARWEDRCK